VQYVAWYQKFRTSEISLDAGNAVEV